LWRRCTHWKIDSLEKWWKLRERERKGGFCIALCEATKFCLWKLLEALGGAHNPTTSTDGFDWETKLHRPILLLISLLHFFLPLSPKTLLYHSIFLIFIIINLEYFYTWKFLNNSMLQKLKWQSFWNMFLYIMTIIKGRE